MTDWGGHGWAHDGVGSEWRDRLVMLKRHTVGDELGLVVFLTAIVFLIGLWRVGLFITDNVTIANTLVNVADGRLAVVESPYSITAGSQPGLVTIDDTLYGRNYGQVYLTLPVLWGLDLLAGFVDVRLLLAAGWSLSILALGRAVASVRGTPAISRIANGIALSVFLVSLPIATDVGAVSSTIGGGPVTPIIALQLVTILAAGIAAVALYRLVSWAHGQRVAVACGLAAILATPLGFWGTIPKRHTFVAATILVVCFWFGRSRRDGGRKALLLRGGAYGMVGFLASVHPFEAAFLLLILFGFDIATAPRNSRRALGIVIAVLAISLVPFALTNVAITGNPLEPTNLHPDAEDGDLPIAGEVPSADGSGGDATGDGAQQPPDGQDQGGATPSGSDGAGSGGSNPIVWLFATLDGAYTSLLWIGSTMTAYLEAGVTKVGEIGALYSVFVRSGWIPGIQHHINDFETIEMALLETLPLAGGMVALPALLVHRYRSSRPTVAEVRTALQSPVRQTDLLVLVFLGTFVVVYLPLMPNNSLITLRYIVPIMPLVVYGLARVEPVRETVVSTPTFVSISYLAAVAIGLVGSVLVIATLDPAVGEGVQFHALFGLVTALIFAGALGTWPLHRRRGAVALTLGAAAGVTTTFVVLASLVYFPYDTHALDLVRLIAEVLAQLG